MNAKEAIKNEIAAMSDAQLRATFNAIDAFQFTPVVRRATCTSRSTVAYEPPEMIQYA